MADQVETKIMEGLNARLEALTFSPALPIAWPNKSFGPPNDSAWLRAWFLPATTRAAALGGAAQNRFIGIYQVDVCVPLDRGGVQASEFAGQIVAQFKRGTSLTRDGVTIRISAPPSLLPGRKDNAWWVVPVSVPYRCDADNPA